MSFKKTRHANLYKWTAIATGRSPTGNDFYESERLMYGNRFERSPLTGPVSTAVLVRARILRKHISRDRALALADTIISYHTYEDRDKHGTANSEETAVLNHFISHILKERRKEELEGATYFDIAYICIIKPLFKVLWVVMTILFIPFKYAFNKGRGL